MVLDTTEFFLYFHFRENCVFMFLLIKFVQIWNQSAKDSLEYAMWIRIFILNMVLVFICNSSIGAHLCNEISKLILKDICLNRLGRFKIRSHGKTCFLLRMCNVFWATGWQRSYLKYIVQITQPSQYANLQYRYAVTSGSTSMI